MKLYKVGWEHEFSLLRALEEITEEEIERWRDDDWEEYMFVKIKYPKNYILSFYKENRIIREARVKPVLAKNKGNLLRRIFYVFDSFKGNGRVNDNYPGLVTARGESCHLHLSFADENLSHKDLLKLTLISLPFMTRGGKFRDTIFGRSFITEYFINRVLSEGLPKDSKEYMVTINTSFDTLEIRINEGFLIPVVVAIFELSEKILPLFSDYIFWDVVDIFESFKGEFLCFDKQELENVFKIYDTLEIVSKYSQSPVIKDVAQILMVGGGEEGVWSFYENFVRQNPPKLLNWETISFAL